MPLKTITGSVVRVNTIETREKKRERERGIHIAAREKEGNGRWRWGNGEWRWHPVFETRAKAAK